MLIRSDSAVKEVKHIDWRGARLIEAVANGHSHETAGKIFYLTPNTAKSQISKTYKALGIAGIGGARKRATAMLIAGGLLRSRDEKIPGVPYDCSMSDTGDSLIKITAAANLPRYNMNYIQLSRGTLTEDDIVLTPERLTYLSCATWGMSVRKISELYPYSDDPEKAYSRTKKELERTYTLLDALDAPQAIAHASFWGALAIDPRVLNPHLKEPPEPIVNEQGAAIPFVRFAHRLIPLETSFDFP